uniref:Uncharacterized protein n=1 Tax=Rhipicephalus microplus TaxID=6941 RepID=A0A6M2DAS2_RHIMP
MRPIVASGHLFYSMPLCLYLLCIVKLVCLAIKVLVHLVLFQLCGGEAYRFSMQLLCYSESLLLLQQHFLKQALLENDISISV